MARKNEKTECNGMEWGDFLIVVERLKKSQQYQFLLFITIGVYCGLRASDILKLRWRDILNKSELHIVEKKTGKSRHISVNESLSEIINLCYNNMKVANDKNYQDSTIVNNKSGKPLSLQYINRKLHEIFKSCKLRLLDESSHVCRKTFGKRVYEQNNKSEASLILLSHIFNHSSTSITRKYIGINQAQIKDVYLSL